MMIFMLLATLMVAIALAFVIAPLMRHARSAPASDAGTRRVRALDAALAAGVIDADEYAAKRTSRSHAKIAPDTHPSRAGFTAMLLAAVLLPASALLLYRLVGAPQALDPANLAAPSETPHADRGPEMEQAIATLAQRLKDHPEDVEGWALLARAQQAMNRVAEALDAYRHAHELAKDNPAITVEYAQALALSAPGHRIDGEARDLLDEVVKADPNNQRALWLLGISDFQAKQYDAAIARWNTLLPLLAKDSEVATSVRKQIAEAEALRDGKTPPSAEMAAANPDASGDAAPTGTATDATSTAHAPKLTVQVALDPKLKDKLDPAATLFVFARAASGPPMPLAIQRLKASQLPLTVTLDDSMAMMPTMKLSLFPQVVVGARVSKSGNAMAQSGDLQVLSAPIDVHRSEPIELKIDQIAP